VSSKSLKKVLLQLLSSEMINFILLFPDILYSLLLYVIIKPWTLTKNYMFFKLWSDVDTFLLFDVWLSMHRSISIEKETY